VDRPDYKPTLNLPRTEFAMRGRLPQREPEWLARWESSDLYGRVLAARADAPPWVLHDGPPYANGHIHIGTALNKVLKDFVVKFRTMAGHRCEYIPGWDCHGLPIELNVVKKLRKKRPDATVVELRQECRSYANRFVDVQRTEFKRLGGLGDWASPYKTMDFAYEAAMIRELSSIVGSGSVYRGRKPVHWCTSCRTALAEAEVEHDDHVSPSIYVAFPWQEPTEAVRAIVGQRDVGVAIWTTTPWTLPANLAVAFHPRFEYALLDWGDRAIIVASELAESVAAACGRPGAAKLGVIPASTLEGASFRHPFIDRPSIAVFADYVTLEAGTGCVHTAPGHGREDYETGVKHGLEPLAPLLDNGCFDDTVEHWAGQHVFRANEPIVEHLHAIGALLNQPGETLAHEYPHCWRCKKPVIFRATEQWFISVDSTGLRAAALEAVERVEWVPRWGHDRIKGMLENRPDWCISRQRSWGVPIPAFYCDGCGDTLMTTDTCEAVARRFEEVGADAWWIEPAADLLPGGTTCASCGGAAFSKETDILDVWFDSGCSWSGGLLARGERFSVPVDLYLEGSDQHRGWFQSSLLVGLAARGVEPYKTVLTHGFVVDGDGRKMSKSLGNVMAPEKVVGRLGADVLRLWVAASDYREDIRISDTILSGVTDAYRKIRNTLRFLLGLLDGFDPEADAVPDGQLAEIDRWMLARLASYNRRVIAAYESYQFHVVYHSTVELVTTDISAFYLDVVKDRAYCSGPADANRRAVQTTAWHTASALARVLAPILPFTAEDIWDHLPHRAGEPDSVHLADLPATPPADAEEGERLRRYEALREIRSAVTSSLEDAREAGIIGKSLQAGIQLQAPQPTLDFLGSLDDDLADLLIVSSVAVGEAGPLEATVVLAEGARCERCWKVLPEVADSEAELCSRCADVVGRIGA
jgi:isoleucyl-tRNA synthetase